VAQRVSFRTLLSRVKKLEKAKPPQTITLSQAISANDPDLTRQILAQFGIEPSAEIIVDKVERELEQRAAQVTGRRLPNGLKQSAAERTEETTDDRQTDSCT
jgi:hypothetical protein